MRRLREDKVKYESELKRKRDAYLANTEKKTAVITNVSRVIGN